MDASEDGLEAGPVLGFLVEGLVSEVGILDAAHLEIGLRQPELAAGLALPALLRVRVEHVRDGAPALTEDREREAQQAAKETTVSGGKKKKKRKIQFQEKGSQPFQYSTKKIAKVY